MATSPTAVNPPTFSMSVEEIQTLGLDATPYLQESQTVSNPTVTLTRVSDGKVITLTDTATVGLDDNENPVLVMQILRGPTELDAGSTYQLRAIFTAAPSIDQFAMDLEVIVTP